MHQRSGLDDERRGAREIVRPVAPGHHRVEHLLAAAERPLCATSIHPIGLVFMLRVLALYCTRATTRALHASRVLDCQVRTSTTTSSCTNSRRLALLHECVRSWPLRNDSNTHAERTNASCACALTAGAAARALSLAAFSISSIALIVAGSTISDGDMFEETCVTIVCGEAIH